MPKRPTRDELPDELPEWERVLSAAATHAGHRLSRDADHVLADLRIKAALILKRNATRDYLDFVALSEHLGPAATHAALSRLDALYPQPNGASALQQLQVQLARPLPFDLEGTDLSEYKHLAPAWHDWSAVCDRAAATAVRLLAGEGEGK